MSDLLQKIKAGTKNTKLVKWPGSDEMVMMRVLSQSELQDAAFTTERYFQSQKIALNMGTGDEYESEKVNQILYRALKDPTAPTKMIAGTITEFRESMTREERSYLINEYLTFEKDCSPSPDNMTDDEWDRFLAEVKKSPEEALGNALSSSTLKKLSITLVNQLANSQMPNGFSLPA